MKRIVTIAQKLEYDELHAMVRDLLMDEKKANFWMKTKNLNFGGASPEELIFRDRGHKVRQFIENAKGELK